MEVNKQKKRPQSIEDLAYAIKFDFDKYNKNKLMRFKSDLAASLLNKLNLYDFAKADLKATTKLDTSWNSDNYDGEVFSRAFKSAMESYGKLDEKTGEIIPFEIIFGSHYKKKKPQIKVNKYEENNYRVETKVKNNIIKLFLQEQVKKLGGMKLPDNLKVEKSDECVEFLRKLKADEKTINKLMDLYTDRYMQRIQPVSENSEDEGISMADFADKDEQVKEVVIDQIANGIDILFMQIEDKSLIEYARYYITMKILLKYKIIGFDNQILDEYIDKDLEQFYYDRFTAYTDEKYIKDIIAEYVGKASDTVRKKIDKVKKIIQNNLLKSASRCN